MRGYVRHGFELITMDKNYAFDVFTREALEAWTIAIQRVCAVLLKKNITKNGVTDTSESVRTLTPHNLSKRRATHLLSPIQDGSWSDSKSCRMALLKICKEDCNMLCADCNARGT
jgi:hypothetical protein